MMSHVAVGTASSRMGYMMNDSLFEQIQSCAKYLNLDFSTQEIANSLALRGKGNG